MLSGVAFALDESAMADKSEVTQCDDIPFRSTFSGMLRSDGIMVCKSMMRKLNNVRNCDVYIESVVVFLFANDKYLNGNAPAIADRLNKIIQLRGLASRPERWRDTVETVLRAWQAFYGNVTPDDVVDFLTATGREPARAMSDDGFLHALAYLNQRKKEY